jgi:opacity protein-like surface antigen
MTVKAEYLYISFGGGSLTETAVGAPSPPSTINVTYGRTNLNAARLGMNWHF